MTLTQVANINKLRNSMSRMNNRKNAEIQLEKIGIDYNSIPVGIRKRICSIHNLPLEKKAGGEWKYSGLVVQLGNEGYGLVNRKLISSGKNMLMIGKSGIFNPSAIEDGRPFVVLTDDIILTLELESRGFSSMATFLTGKYIEEIVANLEDSAIEIPEIVLAMQTLRTEENVRKVLERHNIPYSNIRVGYVSETMDTDAARKIEKVYATHVETKFLMRNSYKVVIDKNVF